MQEERRSERRTRTLLGGKIIFNSGRSAIDCTVRNLSLDGACLAVESPLGIPKHFHLMITGEHDLRSCNLAWQSEDRLGIAFESAAITLDKEVPDELLRKQLSTLQASLDEVQVGIVLLDTELRAQFINSAFRKMWRLSDEKADAKPAFVALMYHGRDSKAYKINPKDIDAFIAQRVALVKAGDGNPLDLRLSSGEVVRFQCAALPDGGRMLSYTYVSDIVTHSDDLEVLKAALHKVDEGIILLDQDLNAQFMNKAVRDLWHVSDAQAEQRPSYKELVSDSRQSGVYGIPPAELDEFIARRIARVKVGDPTAQDLRVSDGRHFRSKCAVLPGGGRMLTYSDITDLVNNAAKLQELATTDFLTGLNNRRHFLELADVEWSRFNRYHRPLSLLMVDIDHFKLVNDKHGHAVGDIALAAVAETCTETKRASDFVARIGGEEFAILLPETDAAQAGVFATRILEKLRSRRIQTEGGYFSVSVSIGLAQATASMSGTGALLKAADQALYQAKEQGRNQVCQFTPLSHALRIAAE